MRKLLALCALAAAVAVVVPADGSAAPVKATLSGIVTDEGGFIDRSYMTIEGEGTLSGVGRVAFVASWQSGCFRDNCSTGEQVVLTAKNGDTLTLSGGTNTQDLGGLIVPWNVLDGTGRFASASGNGTFSFNTSTATIVLTGTLSR